MKKNLLFLFVLLVSFLSINEATAQNSLKKVFGVVLDEDDTNPLVGANVLMKTTSDSLLKATYTDKNGKFEFKSPIPRSFILEVSYVGYDNFKQRFILVSNEDLGTIRISSGKLLSEIVIQGPPVTGEMKGDTAVFNASAFTTRPDADAEDLIRKLPGVTIEGNSIRAQGEEVRNVLVDGKRFFGNDPMTALRNLPAEIVDKVEIFDERSDQAQLTGFDDGTRNRTINIVTKEDARAGSFGKFYAGYGTDDRYQGGGNFNLFKGNRRLSIIGGANNINQQNFGGQDNAGGFGGGGGMAILGGGRGGAGGGAQGGSTGINTASSVGLNFSDFWGKGFEFNGSYFYNTSSNTLENRLNRELILGSDLSQFYNEETGDLRESANHRLNMNITWNLSDRSAIIMRPNVSFNDTNSENTTFGLNFLPNGTALSSNNNETTREGNSFNFSNNFTYRLRFDKPGRSISTNIITSTNNNDNDTYLNAININPRINRADTINQVTNALSAGMSYNANFVYTEPLSARSNLQANYSLGNNFTDNDQRVFRLQTETGLMNLDTALTNTFDNSYFTQRVGFGYVYNYNKLNINTNLNYQFAKLQNERLFPTETETELQFNNLIPTVNATYRFTPMQNLRFNYRGTTQNPSINQLQDVVSNANPLQLSSGNPNLKQNFGHFMTLNYTSFNLENARTFLVFLTSNITGNYIGNATYIAQQDTLINGTIPLARGGQFTRPENMGGSITSRAFVTYGSYVKGIKSNLNLNSAVTYSQIPGIVNGRKNFNRNTTVSQGLTLSSNISESLDFTLSSTANYNFVESSLNQNADNDFFTQVSSFRFFYRFAGKWFVTNTTAHQLYRGLGEEFNQSVWLLNAEIGRKFFEKDQGELKLSVFDALGQNQAISRTISDISIEDRNTTVLQQYFMLTFTYNLRSFGSNNQQQQRGGMNTMMRMGR